MEKIVFKLILTLGIVMGLFISLSGCDRRTRTYAGVNPAEKQPAYTQDIKTNLDK